MSTSTEILAEINTKAERSRERLARAAEAVSNDLAQGRSIAYHRLTEIRESNARVNVFVAATTEIEWLREQGKTDDETVETTLANTLNYIINYSASKSSSDDSDLERAAEHDERISLYRALSGRRF